MWIKIGKTIVNGNILSKLKYVIIKIFFRVSLDETKLIFLLIQYLNIINKNNLLEENFICPFQLAKEPYNLFLNFYQMSYFHSSLIFSSNYISA